jgi:hypothetical protein
MLMNEVRYIVLGSMRSGTTVVNESLELHPELNVAYEVLHSNFNITLTNLPHIGELLKKHYGSRKLKTIVANFSNKCRLEPYFDTGGKFPIGSYKCIANQYDLSKLLEDVLKEYNGFKILYHQASRNSDSVWNYLRDYQGLKVIHVIRRNYLRNIISLYVAHASGVWQNQNFPKADLRFEISANVLGNFFEYMDFIIEHFASLFSNKEMLTIEYDEIENWNQLIKKIQVFLGVTPMELRPKCQKIMTYNCFEHLSNYYDLQTKFSDTKWAWFFEEDQQKLLLL